jgi:hypothetical protein
MPEYLSFACHEIDHIVPKKHGGSTASENLALACVPCNKRKGSDLAALDPTTGEIAPLFHPRRHVWNEHFQLKDDGYLLPLTAEGRATVSLLQLNRLERIEERRLLHGL